MREYFSYTFSIILGVFFSVIFRQQNSRLAAKQKNKNKKSQTNWCVFLTHTVRLCFCYAFLSHVTFDREMLTCFLVFEYQVVKISFYTETTYQPWENFNNMALPISYFVWETHTALMICHCLQSDFSFARFDSFLAWKDYQLNSVWLKYYASCVTQSQAGPRFKTLSVFKLHVLFLVTPYGQSHLMPRVGNLTTNIGIMCSFCLNRPSGLADTAIQIQGDIIKSFPRNSAWVDQISQQEPD